MFFSTKAFSDEVNIKFASLVDHKVNYGFDWNEGWNNRAKGIEYLYDTDNTNWGIGLTYLNFSNSYSNKTIAKGLVIRHRHKLTDNVSVHSKVYYLKQRGYYGYQIGRPDEKGNEFNTPMFSVGLNYKGFTIDGLAVPDKLTAIAFGYAWTF